MTLQYNPTLLWLLFPGIALLWIGLYIESRPIKKRESRFFSLLMYAGSLWALAGTIQMIVPDFRWQNIWNTIAYLGILIVPTAWFLLAVRMTAFSLGRFQWIERWLWAVPLLTYLTVLSNEFHQLFFTFQGLETIEGFTSLQNEFGPLFYLHTVLSYILTLGGAIILGFTVIRNPSQFGTRAYGVLIGVLTPLAMNAYYLFGDIPQGFPDPTPMAFTVTGVAFAWAIIGGRMLEIVPLAHGAIVQNLSTGVMVLDAKQAILSMNPTAAGILGTEDSGVQERTLSELVKRLPAIEPLASIISAAGDPTRTLEIIIPESGRTFDVSVTSVGDDDRRLSGWLVQFSDISQRVVAEANLASTQETFEKILDTLQDGYFEADMNGVITFGNQAFVNALGFQEKQEVVGKHFRHFVHQKSIRDIYASFQKLFKDKRSQNIAEYYFTRKDGEERIAEYAASPILKGDEIVGSRGIIRDITRRLRTETDLARSQTNFSAVLDTLQDSYFEADSSGVVTAVNNACWRGLGYSSKEDMLGKSFKHFTYPQSIQKVNSHFRKLYETKRPIERFDYYYQRRDGSVRIADMVASPILENGDVAGTRGIIRDITASKEAEEALRAAKEMAEERASELAAINRVANLVNRTLDLDEILQTICVELTTIFPVRNTGIALLNEKENALEVISFHSVDPEEESALGLTMDLERNLASQEVLNTRKTVVIQDAQTDPRTKPIHELSKNRDSRSFMIVPLSSRGQVIGTIGMPTLDPTYAFGEIEIELAETIASQIAAAVDNAKLYGQTEMALEVAERDLEIGSQIQSGFFPYTLPEIAGWELSAHFQAARQVAGDFYDIFQFKDTNFTALIIADVCDKGVGAALFMVLSRTLLRAFSEIEIDKHNVLERLKDIVLKTNNFIANFHGRSNMFATMFFGILDPDQNNLYYVNGGHEPPVIMNKDGQLIRRLMPTGPAVGLFPDLKFETDQIHLEAGDILLGFTDGATDAINGDGERFTEERLLSSVLAPWTSIFSMVFELYTALQNHSGGQDQYDDITLISFRRKEKKDVDFHAVCREATMDSLGELRDFVEAAAINSGLDSESVFAFKLAAEEICSNIVLYGFEGQEPGFITIAFEKEKGMAKLSIWDDGLHFPPQEAVSPDTDADWQSRQIGGLGIYLVSELMDDVIYKMDENENNLLVLEKRLKEQKSMENSL